MQTLDLTNKKVVVTGHSLGAALATLLGLDIKVTIGISPEVYAFACPNVGDQTFASFYNGSGPVCYRIVVDKDIVPTLPFTFTGYANVGQTVTLIADSNIQPNIAAYHNLQNYLYLIGKQTVDPRFLPVP